MRRVTDRSAAGPATVRLALAVAAVLATVVGVLWADRAVGPPPPRRDVVVVPCRPVPVPGGGSECRYELDARELDGAELVVLDPAPERT